MHRVSDVTDLKDRVWGETNGTNVKAFWEGG